MTAHAGHSISVASDKIETKNGGIYYERPEKQQLACTKVGDYYIPDLALDDQPDKEVGFYGRMRERYLQEHHPGRYS